MLITITIFIWKWTAVFFAKSDIMNSEFKKNIALRFTNKLNVSNLRNIKQDMDKCPQFHYPRPLSSGFLKKTNLK